MSTDLKPIDNYGDSEGVVRSTDISNQISTLIQDVEEMIRIQKRMKENFRQNIWHSFDGLNYSQETVCSTKMKSENDTASPNLSLTSDQQPFESYWHRLFGEIAHRLDMKIINFVTAGIHSKLIVFSVNDFYHQIKKACHQESWVMSPCRAKHLYRRLEQIVDFLSQFGYSLDIHAHFSRCMQHKYGRLKNKYYCHLANWSIRNSQDSVMDLLSSLAQNTFEEENIQILYKSLLALCEHDECPF